MTARVVMLQGTASSVGKSILTAALCRILVQDGLAVAPFKAQNMANNSYVTLAGGEIGRAQALQAAAAGIEPSTDMNPVLLKPEADSRSQVVVNGQSRGSMAARDYYRHKNELWPEVTAALGRLRSRFDVVVIEGAGSPAEVNLRDSDIANMRVALHAQSPVLLVGDIDRGGVFASLLGTLELLEPNERSLVKGLIINRFRGDRAVLEPLPSMIAERTGVPVLGVVPFLKDLRLSDEDAADLEHTARRDSTGPGMHVAVIRLPRISNFDDIDPLRRAGLRVTWADGPQDVRGAHIIIIPGTKSTLADLKWMKERGLDRAIRDARTNLSTVIGICGGYQMLCDRLVDPDGVESSARATESGLSLLKGTTEFRLPKTTRRVKFELVTSGGLLSGEGAAAGAGYEIHNGVTTPSNSPALLVDDIPEGQISEDGWVLGTYVHGLFDSPAVLGRIVANIAHRWSMPAPVVSSYSLDVELDRLANAVRASLDMECIRREVGIARRVSVT